MSRARPMPRSALAEVLRLGAQGLTWPQVGARLGLPPTSACRRWHQHASDRMRERRAIATRSYRYRGDPEGLAQLIAAGRSGALWAALGGRFYPNAPPELAAAAVHNMFSRHASPADKTARRTAMRQQNCNRVPGLSIRAEKRRVQRGRDKLAVQPERHSPFAGMGTVFA